MADKTKRVSIGFHAAPPLTLRLTDGVLSGLQDALGREGWHEVDAEDATVSVDLGQVIFLRVEKDEQRVGFGLGS